MPQRRGSCSKSPVERKFPSRSCRFGRIRKSRRSSPTRNGARNRCIVSFGEDSCDENDEYYKDSDDEFDMKVPERCDEHVFHHMRDNCRACTDCISKWRKAIKRDFKAQLTAVKTRKTKRSVSARRSCSPDLHTRRPCPEKKVCRDYRRRSKPRSKSCGSCSCRRKSPRVSWWFGGGQCTSPERRNETSDVFARPHFSRTYVIPRRDTQLPHKSQPSRSHNFGSDSGETGGKVTPTATTDRSHAGVTKSTYRSENTARLQPTNSTNPDYHLQSTLPVRSRRSKFLQQDSPDQGGVQRENRSRFPPSNCQTCPSKNTRDVTQSSPVPKRDRAWFTRHHRESPKQTNPSNATYILDSGSNAREKEPPNKVYQTGGTTPNWRGKPSWCPRYPECRPFCPSEAVMTTGRPNTQSEWADRHSCLMLECNTEKYATAKERTQRLLNKSKELKKSMSNMCLDFGDLEQRLEKVQKLQKRFADRTSQAVREIHERRNAYKDGKGEATEDDERRHDFGSLPDHGEKESKQSPWTRSSFHYGDGEWYRCMCQKMGWKDKTDKDNEFKR